MRWAAVLLMPLMLASCVLAPGRFTSTLTINADRSFAFTYVGEVISAEADMSGLGDLGEKPGAKADDPAAKARKKAEADAKNRALAEALSKESGYRKVVYQGDGVFLIDYSIKGSLDHGFFWPLNIDAEVILPFVAIELRKDGVVRMKAPAFANEGSKSAPGMPGADALQGASRLDGTLTFDTDAEIISQSSEDGVATAGSRKTIVWKATPLLKTAPSVVLRLAPAAP